MTRLDLLRELQDIDTRIADNARTRQEISARLADDSATRAVQAEFDNAQRALHAQRAQLRALEMQADAYAEKIKGVDARLYGGTVSNPKELSGLNQDEQMLKRRKNEVEDQMLDTMAAIETAERAVNEKRAALEKTQQLRAASNARDEHALRELEKRAAELAHAREQIIQHLNADDARVYENLRREIKGRAVARIKGVSCSACGYEVPNAIASRARVGEELAFCVNCGRILVP
jgi:predicted  nucleic acid-binding Zn-ribbon protein